MKEESGRWQRRIWAGRRESRRARLGDISAHATGVAAPETAAPPHRPCDLAPRIARSAFAFRGYDVSNIGRSDELLAHRLYGALVRRTLNEVSEVASDTLHRTVDLVERVETQDPSSLASFPDDVALIVGMELAQLRVLDEVFGLSASRAKMMLGYSIGELTAAIVGGVYALDQLLPVPLELATDCAELPVDTAMGVLFTRGPILDEDDVIRVCRTVSAEGYGLIGPSAFLSPNTALDPGRGQDARPIGEGHPRALPQADDAPAEPEPLAAAAFADRLEAEHPQPRGDAHVPDQGRVEAAEPDDRLVRHRPR